MPFYKVRVEESGNVAALVGYLRRRGPLDDILQQWVIAVGCD